MQVRDKKDQVTYRAFPLAGARPVHGGEDAITLPVWYLKYVSSTLAEAVHLFTLAHPSHHTYLVGHFDKDNDTPKAIEFLSDSEFSEKYVQLQDQRFVHPQVEIPPGRSGVCMDPSGRPFCRLVDYYGVASNVLIIHDTTSIPVPIAFDVVVMNTVVKFLNECYHIACTAALAVRRYRRFRGHGIGTWNRARILSTWRICAHHILPLDGTEQFYRLSWENAITVGAIAHFTSAQCDALVPFLESVLNTHCPPAPDVHNTHRLPLPQAGRRSPDYNDSRDGHPFD